MAKIVKKIQKYRRKKKIQTELPDSVYDWRFATRCCYLGGLFIVTLFIYNLDDTYLWKEDNKTRNWYYLSVTLLLELLAIGAMFRFQGSNPGYLSEKAVVHGHEGKALVGERDINNSKQSFSLKKDNTIERDTFHPDYHKNTDLGIDDTISLDEIKLYDDQLDTNHEHRGQPERVSLDPTPIPQQSHFCEICQVDQIVRAKHCRSCNRCVSVYDHHCETLSTCVGEKNHARFWWMLLFNSILVCNAFSIVSYAFHSADDVGDWIWENAWPIFLFLVLIGIGGFLFPLLGFHTWIAVTNSTSYEIGKESKFIWYLKDSGMDECDLPFSEGFIRNIINFCFVNDGICSREKKWAPRIYTKPQPIDRESEDILHNVWENKYWSCC